MHKSPGKDLHVKVRERWVNRNRQQSRTADESQQMQDTLKALFQDAAKKTLKVIELMQMKARETIHLQAQVDKAFIKNSDPVAQKALVKANIELSNHLHRVERELGLMRIEIKKIRSAAHSLAEVLRKKERTGSRASYTGQ